jgi:hypothetical protein
MFADKKSIKGAKKRQSKWRTWKTLKYAANLQIPRFKNIAVEVFSEIKFCFSLVQKVVKESHLNIEFKSLIRNDHETFAIQKLNCFKLLYELLKKKSNFD